MQYNAKFTDNFNEKDDYGARPLQLTVSKEESGWDSSTWKYVPHSLKGIKPVTNEPWARDEAVYHESRNSVDTRGAGMMEEETEEEYAREVDDTSSWDASRSPPKGAMKAYPA